MTKAVSLNHTFPVTAAGVSCIKPRMARRMLAAGRRGRIFDVASAKLVQVYAGYGFATCASKGAVAYVADPDEADPKKLRVQLLSLSVVGR